MMGCCGELLDDVLNDGMVGCLHEWILGCMMVWCSVKPDGLIGRCAECRYGLLHDGTVC